MTPSALRVSGIGLRRYDPPDHDHLDDGALAKWHLVLPCTMSASRLQIRCIYYYFILGRSYPRRWHPTTVIETAHRYTRLAVIRSSICSLYSCSLLPARTSLKSRLYLPSRYILGRSC